MVDYYKVREKLEKELETEIEKIHGEMTPSGFCTVKDLLCAIQYASTIAKMDESSEAEGYSQGMGMPYAQNSYAQGRNSYAAGGRQRNTLGQYSGMRMPRYSRDDGMDQMLSTFEMAMGEAKTERSREAIRRAIEALEME